MGKSKYISRDILYSKYPREIKILVDKFGEICFGKIASLNIWFPHLFFDNFRKI